MEYYPVNLDIRDRLCLVVGGGGVGQRKSERLIRCGAMVHVVSLRATDALERMAAGRQLTISLRPFRESDLDGVFLVFCTTNDPDTNRRVSEAADNRGLLCNVADMPDRSRFILPSVVQRGDLILTVSTSGKSPAVASSLRNELEGRFGEEYAQLLSLMGAIRQQLLGQGHDPDGHRELFRQLLDGGLLKRITVGDRADIEAYLGRVLGAGFDHRALLDALDV
ncbi:MAG: bifunctional precorrin-2 dehydrogenase/sirohydrochlorin ferrochelatase [Desulfobacterales bacterium]|jgi:precorrin-2 dehydrogenase/sirohydrochlorin ferrochelatase